MPGQNHRPMDNIVHKDISRYFFLFCILSLLFHVCVLGLCIGISLLELPAPLVSDVVQVDLVSLGSPPATEPETEQFPTISEPEPSQPPEPAPQPEPEQPSSPPEETIPEQFPEPEDLLPETDTESEPVDQPDISIKAKPKDLEKMLKEKEAPKKIVKKPLKKLRPKPDAKKILNLAKKRLTEQLKKQEQAKQKQIAQALERMNEKVQKGQKPKRGSRTASSGGVSGIAGAKNGRKANDALDLYKMILSSAIRQNWIFNESMTRINQGLEVRLLIKILQSGEIRDIIYEKRSGNHYLDDSAKKAIQRANPLPPLPNGMKSYNIGVIFTPRGLQ